MKIGELINLLKERDPEADIHISEVGRTYQPIGGILRHTETGLTMIVGQSFVDMIEKQRKPN